MNQTNFDRLFALLATAVVTVSVIAGFWWLGSPNRQRQIRADQQRIRDIHEIASRLHQQAQQSQNRGKSVELQALLSPNNRKTDPISGEPYEYQRLDTTHYQICAEFAADSAQNRLGRFSWADKDLWDHLSGRHCFKLNVLEEPPQLRADLGVD